MIMRALALLLLSAAVTGGVAAGATGARAADEAQAVVPQSTATPAPASSSATPSTANAPAPDGEPATGTVKATPARPVVAIPALPPDKPNIPESAKDKGVAAKVLFSSKKLPSLGKAMAIGYYPRGCLQGAVEFPTDGPTWQVMRLSRNRYWGHPELIQFLKYFAPAAAKATGWKGVLIGDLGQPRGGPTPFGHASHQIGLDVDIWFMPMPDHTLSDEEREKISATNLVAADGLNVNPKSWSPADAAFIRAAAEHRNVERVLVNAAIKKKLCDMQGTHHPAWMYKVRPWYGHADHIHVRLKCPPDSPQCRPQEPVRADAGCEAKDLAYWFKPGVLHPKPSPKPAKPHALTMADLPPACKNVLAAPDKKTNLAGDRH